MPRSRTGWSDEDKAAAYVVWISNDKNNRRTARNTGLPGSTLRYWVKEWEENGPPEGVLDKLPAAQYEFVQHASSVREQAMKKLEELLPDAEVKQLSAIATVVGIMDDKIRLASGLATKRVENTLTLPSRDEMQELMGSFVSGMVTAAEERAAEVVDAEIITVEQPEKGLPSGKGHNE